MRALAPLLLGAFVAAGCAPSAQSPQGGGDARFGKVYEGALEAEQRDSASPDRWLEALDQAVRDPKAPGAFALARASLDALVTADVPGLDALGASAVAFRSRAGMVGVVRRLERAYAEAGAGGGGAELVLMRGAIAASLHEIALYAGDLRAAEAWSDRRGCAGTATMFGPLDWTPLNALAEGSPVAPTGPLPESLRGVAPFAATAPPAIVRADQCQLDANAPSYVEGLRLIVVDFENPRAQAAHFALTTSAAAVLDVGGVRTVARGFDGGGHAITRFGSIELPAGRVRAVVRLAQKGESATFELDAFGDDGRPLTAHAPRRGDVAHVVGGVATPLAIAPASRAAEEATLAAAGLMAVGDARGAEHLLEPRGADASARSAALELVYARALEAAEDVPENKATERMRVATDHALAAWPTSWEGRLNHARATERRKGQGDGLADAMRELAAEEIDGKPVPHERMLVAYMALSAKRMQMLDVVEAAYAEVAALSPGSGLLAGLDARIHARSGADQLRAACQGGTRRADLDCLEARRSAGDIAGAMRELERLRRLRGAPEGLREVEIAMRIADGDLRGALAVYDTLKPGDRRLYEAVGLAAGRDDPAGARRRLARDKTTARDAPFSVAAIERVLGVTEDPAPALEAEGKKLVSADLKAAFLPGAATAVLKHDERYTIEASGLVHFVTYDLRRVSGTTDVANQQGTFAPIIEGRGTPRIQRRRIHKKDGRVLEPDPATNAQQASDLSQLETGDYIEQIIEGYALPGDTGQLVIDTPDLMPERTSVREATIQIRRAADVPFSVWAHALLGKAEEKRDARYVVTTWHLKDQAPRRIEDGVPRAERGVAVSIGTHTWAAIARGMGENLRSYDGDDPLVRRFAEAAAAGDTKPSRALLDRVIAAVGKAVKIAVPIEMSDVAGMYSSGPQKNTARTAIEMGTGSRTWVVYRALRELGVAAEVAAAESEPFSSAAGFPAHAGRFRHPLVVAHLPAAGGAPAEDVLIDADVEGPPLPAGRVSPELRGRTAMVAGSGRMFTVEGAAGESGDQVDLRLALDDRGDATGTFVIIMHGRASQALAEAFETVVGTDRRELLRAVVLAWIPWADVDEVVVSSAAGAWEIVLRAQIAVHGYARPEGKDGKVWTLPGLEPVHAVFPHRYVGTLANTYASRGGRQSALSVDVPLQYEVRRAVKLPAGATVARAAGDLEAVDPHLTARRKSTVSGGVVEDHFTLNVPTGTVTAEQYEAFVKRVYAVDDGFMMGARVRVKP